MDSPDILTRLSGWLTVVVAVIGVGFAVLNHLHARRLRTDALFDRRYAFYQRVRDIWLASGTGAPEHQDPELHLEDLIPIAEEARFIFGKDIEEHILGLSRKGHQGSPFFPDDDFVKPFGKYLKLGR